MKRNEADNRNRMNGGSSDRPQAQSENLIQHNKRAAAIQEKLDAENEQSSGVIDGMTGTFHRIDTEKEAAKAEARLPWYKRPFFSKIRYAIIALIIALTLWGYVLMSQNPARTKAVENVKLNFEVGAESDLKSRGLIVNDDLNELLSTVTVKVRTTLNDLPRFNSSMTDVVTASISLSDIREPGTYVRNIVATTSIGTVESVEPRTVTITVENLRSSNIPIKVEFINELPEGYWHSEPQLSQTSITVTGPESIISEIRSGKCVIDLNELTERLYLSFPVILLDADNEEIELTNAIDAVPSVIVSMDVLPMREFNIKDLISVEGLNEELYDYTVSVIPETIALAAPMNVLDSIDDIIVEPFLINDFTVGIPIRRFITLTGIPDEAINLSMASNRVTVTVDITDKIIEKKFEYRFSEDDIIGKLPDNNYQIKTVSNVYNIVLKGAARLLSAIAEDDIRLIVDASAYTSEGIYSEITPELSVSGNPSWLSDGTVEVSFNNVTLVVSPKPLD